MAVTTRKGSAMRHEALGLSLDDVKGMYRYVLMTRLVSERILQLNRMGRTPFGAGTDGQEGAQIGAAWCIQRGKDWTVPYYRDMGLAFGVRRNGIPARGRPCARLEAPEGAADRVRVRRRRIHQHRGLPRGDEFRGGPYAPGRLRHREQPDRDLDKDRAADRGQGHRREGRGVRHARTR